MKCDVVYTNSKESESADNADKLKQLRGRGFKDEREYLAFLLEQEQIWEQEHLGKDDNTDEPK